MGTTMSDQDITKNGDTVIITTTQTEVFDLSVMRNELEMLENEPEPTTEQIVAAVKSNQSIFYYSPERQHKIDWLKNKIIELEKP